MTGYRKTIKEHFESIPTFKRLLDIDFIFWGLGLALSVLGGCLTFVVPAAGGAISGVGTWMAYFGIVLAFIKKNDWGLMIPLLGLAIFDVILFIVTIAMSSGYGSFGAAAIPIALLFDTLAYGILFILAYRASDSLKNAEIKRAQEAALLSQQMKSMGGAVCASCGAVIAGDAQFCNTCGAKRPEQKKCPCCGNALEEGAGFCNKCGAKVVVMVKCPACGKDVSADDLFCPGCGAKTNG